MNTASRKHNPAFLTDEQLVALFCVRTQEYEALIDVLRESTGSSSQHQIVIGPRGSGKTSLLLRVAAEIRRNDELSLGFFPVVFAEESYEVATVGHFWLECLERLSEQAPSPQEAELLRRTYEELRTTGEIGAMGDRCLGALLDFADRQKKRLVVIVENLQMMFSDIEDPDAGWRLRKTLQTEPRIILFSSATSRFDEIDNPKQAMYDLFRIRTLQPLTTGECAILWERISGRCPAPETIRSLQILTGGNPRLLVVVANFGADLSFRSLMDSLLDLVDDHTEYFKGHLESLPAQERRVYLALARLWKPASAREVAEHTLLGTSKCSAQLKRLIRRGAVQTAGGSARRKYYYLTERLYNIYYLLRRNRKSEPLVEALVRFMEAYYSPAELLDIGARLVHEEASSTDDSGLLPRIALTHLIASPALVDQRETLLAMMPGDLVKALEPKPPRTRPAATKKGRATDGVARSSRRSKRDLTKKTGLDLFKRVGHQLAHEQFEDALSSLDQLLRRVGKSKESPIPQLVANSMSMKGMVLYVLDRKQEAMDAWNDVMLRYGESDEPLMALAIVAALVFKGLVLQETDQPEQALEALDEAVRRCSSVELGLVPSLLEMATFNRALVLEKLGRIDDAICTYEDFDRRYGLREDSALRETVAKALINKAVLRAKQDRFEEVLKLCDEIVNRYGDRNTPTLVEATAKALSFKARTLRLMNRLQDALNAFDEIVLRFENVELTSVSDLIALTLVDRGIVLSEQENYEGALSAYKNVETRYEDSESSIHLEATARALVNKTFVLHKLGRVEEMLATCEELELRYENSENPILLEATARILLNKGTALHEQGLLQEAVDTYHQVVRRSGKSKSRALLELVQSALLAVAELEMARGDFAAAAERASEVIGQDQIDSTRKRSIGYLVRAKSNFAVGEKLKCEQDISAALELLPEFDSIAKAIVDRLISFCVDLGAERMLELIQQSPSASLLLPLATALERELGNETRVAIEVEEVAADIQMKLAALRKQPDRSRDR